MSEKNGDESSAEEIAEEIRRAMPEPFSGGYPRHEESSRALATAQRHVVPGLDAGTKIAFAKKFLLRILRIITRSQGTYNAAMLEGVRELQQKLGDSRREGEDLRQMVVRLDGRLAEIASAADEIRTQKERDVIEIRAESTEHSEILRKELERDLAAVRASLTDNVADLRKGALSDVTRLQRDIDLVHARLSRQERAGSVVAGAGPSPPAAFVIPAAARLPDGFYVRFEEQFRGSEDVIRARQNLYAKFFEDSPGTVLDCGCGRGEFLEVLRAHQIASQGVDTNAVSVGLAAAKGLEVTLEDAFASLRRHDSDLGGVAALQVVEHFDPVDVYQFLELALAALAPGGRLLVETINPDSVYALRAYRLDPTHRWPVPASTLELMAREVGFEARRIEMLSPVPESERLLESEENDRRLNRLLFAPQDYALFAEKTR